jgi:PqqD family protein of HPr-rel-A system
MSLLSLAPAVQIQSLGQHWAAYSPLSGETLLLNDAAAAILEVLADGPSEEHAIAAALAADVGQSIDTVQSLMHGAADELAAAGLIVRSDAPQAQGMLPA